MRRPIPHMDFVNGSQKRTFTAAGKQKRKKKNKGKKKTKERKKEKKEEKRKKEAIFFFFYVILIKAKSILLEKNIELMFSGGSKTRMKNGDKHSQAEDSYFRRPGIRWFKKCESSFVYKRLTGCYRITLQLRGRQGGSRGVGTRAPVRRERKVPRWRFLQSNFVRLHHFKRPPREVHLHLDHPDLLS